MALDPRLPNFFILGAAKCGTTSLYHYLRQHPEIYLPKDKEPHFFDSDVFWNEGLEKYLQRHFKGAQRYPARGEATPAYFHCWQKVIPRMKEVYGEESPKFILIFRDPVERAWSHYLHIVRVGKETESFERALEIEETRLCRNPNLWRGYFRDGLYAKQLIPWLKAFGKNRFLFLLSEELAEQPSRTLQKVFHFLGVKEQVKIGAIERKNVASEPRFKWLHRLITIHSPLLHFFKVIFPPYTQKRVREYIFRINSKPLHAKPELDEHIAQQLRAAYKKDIKELEVLINKDLSHWLGSIDD